MENLEDSLLILNIYDRIYEGGMQKMMNAFFKWSFKHNEKLAKAFIFPNSPIFSINPDKGPLINYLPESSDIVQLLINFGVNIDEQDTGSGMTALHSYISLYAEVRDNKHKYFNIIKILLKSGANREIRNHEGLTPIQLSLFVGKSLEIVEEFLKEEDKLPNVIEFDRIKRCRHVIKCLLEEKSDLNWNVPYFKNYSILLHFLAFQKDENFFISAAQNLKFDVNARNHKGYTLLYVVAENGTARMMDTLNNMGVDFDADVLEYKTPLISAMTNPRSEVFHYLLDCEAYSVNKIQGGSLNYAVYLHRKEMVEKLVKLGADVNGLEDHKTPLLFAAGKYCSRLNSSPKIYNFGSIVKDNFYIAKFLLDNGADIEAKDQFNRTSLDLACRFNKLHLVKLFLNRGAKVDQGDVSTLHNAFEGKNPEIIKLILEQGADVNAIAHPVRRETPLHLACFSDYVENNSMFDKEFRSRLTTIILLLKHNANVNALDGKGLVPLNYALRNYMLSNEVNILRNISSDFNKDLGCLVSFIAKMIEAGEYVIENNRRLLEGDIIRPFYAECVKELSLMRKTNICELRKFSFLSILCKDIQLLSSVLENEDICEVLNSNEYEKKFPIYGVYLKVRIQDATILQRYIYLTFILFQKHISRDFLVDITFNIFKYLNLWDFKNFAIACFVNIKF